MAVGSGDLKHYTIAQQKNIKGMSAFTGGYFSRDFLHVSIMQIYD